MSIRMRPRYERDLSSEPAAVIESFRVWKSKTKDFRVNLLEGQVELAMADERRHFWSPTLSIVLTSTSQGASLRGKFGPNPNVWSLFLAAYAILWILAFSALIFALSQWQLGMVPTALAVSVLCVFLSMVVWVTGQVGQRLAAAQIEELRTFVDKVLRDM